jgi:hypothetical protein
MDRRALLRGLAAIVAGLSLPGLLDPDDARAQGTQRFSRIIVDTKPLEARGGRAAAAIIRPQLQASLQREFSGQIGGSGPALVVRLQTVLLSLDTPSGRGRPMTDYLEADVVAGARSFPLLVTQDNVGDWRSPFNEQQRLRALADSLASWVRRGV